VVSVKSDESDVVLGLELGAEDYLVKPFRRRELLARVRLVLRRFSGEADAPKYTVGPFAIDYRSYTFTVNSKVIPLTPREFELMGFLMSKNTHIVTRASISESVWGVEYTGSTRTIDVHVDQIRRKLGAYGECIKSLKGIGYRFESDAVTPSKVK
jgi:DNA-binding response OmpR family regulator